MSVYKKNPCEKKSQNDGQNIDSQRKNEQGSEVGLIVSNQRIRYAGIDYLRGIILISMILFHGSWDVVYLFGAEWDWFQSGFAYVWQQSICWSFILLSGFCWPLGRNIWKRGLIIFLAGVLVTVVTKLFMPSGIIIFGVLTFIGSSMLLMIPLDKVLRHCPSVIGALFFFVLFILTRNVNYGCLGFEKWNWMSLPENLYANWITTYLGFMEPGFYSADYFSLIPWLFLFVTGYFLYGIFQKHNWMKWFHVPSCSWFVWLEWLGKHSLIVYILHQPIVYGVLLILL